MGDVDASPPPAETVWTPDDFLRKQLLHCVGGMAAGVILLSFILEMTGRDWRGWATTFLPLIAYLLGVATPALFRIRSGRRTMHLKGRRR
jgi:hypothetical protein